MSNAHWDYSGYTTLITGGGSGIGAELALAFARAGSRVVIAGRRAEPLEALAQQHSNIEARPTDVTDPEAVNRLFADLDQIHIAIANAGAAASGSFKQLTPRQWQDMLDVNLTGVFLTLQAALARMTTGGRLLTVASTAGLKGYPYVAPYCAAKHGAVGLVRALALETAREGITVNALCPGFTETPLLAESVQTIVAKTGLAEPEAKATLTHYNPQKRLIDPAEVVATALWVASPGASAINGQAIAIAGGEV